MHAIGISLKKLDQMKEQLGGQTLNKVVSELSQRQYKSRFMVKVGEHIRSIKINEIALFYAEGRTVYLVNNDDHKFIIDFKMEELEEMLDPKEFYRLNRSFIININAIEEVLVYSNSRLKILPKVNFDKEMIVSRDKVVSFKAGVLMMTVKDMFFTSLKRIYKKNGSIKHFNF